MPFIKNPKEPDGGGCSLWVCDGMWKEISHLSQSTRQPLSISASKAVLVSIGCFCIYRVRVNEGLLILRIRATGVAAGCPSNFTQSRDASKAEIWEGPSQERGEFCRSIFIFTKTEPNQTNIFLLKKSAFFCCILYVLFWLTTTFVSKPSYSYSPNCYTVWS